MQMAGVRRDPPITRRVPAARKRRRVRHRRLQRQPRASRTLRTVSASRASSTSRTRRPLRTSRPSRTRRPLRTSRPSRTSPARRRRLRRERHVLVLPQHERVRHKRLPRSQRRERHRPIRIRHRRLKRRSSRGRIVVPLQGNVRRDRRSSRETTHRCRSHERSMRPAAVAPATDLRPCYPRALSHPQRPCGIPARCPDPAATALFVLLRRLAASLQSRGDSRKTAQPSATTP